MIMYVALAGILTDGLVKLIRGHPAQEKEIRKLRERLDDLEHHIGGCVAALEETRAALEDEVALRTGLEERLDFAERLLVTGREGEGMRGEAP